MERLIVDTDVLIDALRQHEKAVQFLYSHREALSISAVNLFELYAAVKDKSEIRDIVALRRYMAIIPLSEAIAVRAGEFRNRYGKSHGSGIVDCMVAATAVEERLTLVTLNKKHYPMLDIHVPYQKS